MCLDRPNIRPEWGCHSFLVSCLSYLQKYFSSRDSFHICLNWNCHAKHSVLVNWCDCYSVAFTSCSSICRHLFAFSLYGWDAETGFLLRQKNINFGFYVFGCCIMYCNNRFGLNCFILRYSPCYIWPSSLNTLNCILVSPIECYCLLRIVHRPLWHCSLSGRRCAAHVGRV